MLNIDTVNNISLFLSAMASIVVVSSALYKYLAKYVERTKNPLKFKSLSIPHISKLKKKKVISDKMSASLINNADKRIFRENYKINLTKVYRDLIFNIEEQTDGILDGDIFKIAESYIQYTNGIIRISNNPYYKFLHIFYNFMSLAVSIIIVINISLFFITLYLSLNKNLNNFNYINLLFIFVTCLIYIYVLNILIRANRSIRTRDLIIKCLLPNSKTTNLFNTFEIKHSDRYIDIVAINKDYLYENLIREEDKYKLSPKNWMVLGIMIYILFLSYTAGAITIMLLN